MKMNRVFSVLILAVFTFSALPALFAEEDAAAPPMPAGFDPAKMAEAKIKGAPSEHHKVLDSLAGDWNHTVTWKMGPDAAPQQSQGTNTNQWIMGGRFLQSESQGQMMGEPFHGMGILGYDNVKEEYTSVWIDDMSTGMMSSTGQYDEASKTISEKGTFSCPMTGEKNMEYRAEWKITDPNQYSYSMYQKGPDGREFKGLEVVYTRK